MSDTDDDALPHLQRASAGARRRGTGGALPESTWAGWANVGKSRPTLPVSKKLAFTTFALDVDTRWGSTLRMLNSFKTLGGALLVVMKESPEMFKDYDGEFPTVVDLVHVDAVIDILLPFERVTTFYGTSLFMGLGV